MKILAWYTIIISILMILAFILSVAKLIPPPPFTALEGIVWALAMVPVLFLGIIALKRLE